VVPCQFSQGIGKWPEKQILIPDWTYFHCPGTTLPLNHFKSILDYCVDRPTCTQPENQTICRLDSHLKIFYCQVCEWQAGQLAHVPAILFLYMPAGQACTSLQGTPYETMLGQGTTRAAAAESIPMDGGGGGTLCAAHRRMPESSFWQTHQK